MAKLELRVTSVSASSGFRSGGVVGVPRVVAIVLMYTITAMAAPSGLADDSPGLNTQRIEGKVTSIGLGEHVAVRLRSGEKVRGYITAVGNSSFTLSSYKDKSDQVIPYARVADVKTRRTLLPWILAGVVAGTVVVIVLVHAPPTQVHLR